jgi:cyclopropane fatty-acyl-phospholipid synthase-like methyltransferase
MENGKKFYELDDISQKLKQTAEKRLYDAVSKESFETLLDIGCGDGHFIKQFTGRNILGIDINQTMLNEAKGLEGKLGNVDIVSDNAFVKSNIHQYDIITSNYVFTEMKQKELLKAFTNIQSIMKQDGSFYFTITDPRNRDRMVFPGYKLIFDEQYSYEKQDLPFTVLLETTDKQYVDVGIRDVHQPIEVYDSLLKKAGFTEIKRTEIDDGLDCSYAVLYHAKK